MDFLRRTTADVFKIARHGFSTVVDDVEYNIGAGERVRADHPAVAAVPENFEDDSEAPVVPAPADELAAKPTATTPRRG